ncbi:uncharacterized protein DUF4232 [Isoptericola jiangsuensis]|uniref:Uncharacterized protein DUF4232 n=1 Tax=Isoptericola jiangsuensis TaxID=548579 RepID=A0A2A9F138_9MICO|nr:DUF4232 domain-containing protein [Isoptericola jiangsuensis]PFG44481.1 uncharacterized protein DUF4232 [Isoptericola jiangsuensis]
MPRRLVLPTAVVVAALVGLLWWSPWDPALPGDVRRAVDRAAAVPGVVAVEAEAWDDDLAAGGVDVTVRLDPGLDPDAAQDAADAAAAALDGSRSPTPRAVQVTVVVGGSDGPVDAPVRLSSVEDGAVALAYRLRAAGATAVDDVSVTVPHAADLPTAAGLVVDADLFTSPATLRTGDGSVVYDAGLVPRATTATLLADLAARPAVTSVAFTWNQGAPSRLAVTATSADAAADVAAWLTGQDEESVVTPAVAEITVAGDDPVHAWVAGLEPAVVVPHTVPLPDDVEAWPADHAAPDCAGDDLSLALGAPDAAAGQRYLAVLAENTSGRACALDGVPRITYLDADDEPQDDVRTVAASDGVVPGRVVVPPGERAMATLQWGAMSTANDPDVTVALDVVAVDGADAVRLVPQVPAGAGAAGPTTLDVLDGAEVRVSPWVQGASGWATP